MRVYGGDFSRYTHRLNQIKFAGVGNVLDAGAGFGQWSVALSLNANTVYAVDIDVESCEVLSQIVKRNDLSSLHVLCGKLEQLPFEDSFFDGVFSYSALYFTNYDAAIRELYRVLKPGGRCYLNINDLGWYLYLLFSAHNSTEGYNPRLYALKSIMNTCLGRSEGLSIQNGSRFIPKKRFVKRLQQLGFRVLDVKGDGLINQTVDSGCMPFFRGSFLRIPATYEVLAEK